MTFPPLKADRCLLWISLHPDDTVQARYENLRAALKPCRLHPLDTTASAELVIVEKAALEEHLATVRAALGPDDILHKITTIGDRLYVNVIASAAAQPDNLNKRPVDHRPPWLRD